MLTKEDVISHLEALDLNPSRYWVTAGAALLFYGLRETTADIDLGCDRILADSLEARGYDARREADGRRRFHLPGEVDVSEDFGRGPVRLLEGIPVVSPAGVLDLKRFLNREKDQADIRRLEVYLQTHPES